MIYDQLFRSTRLRFGTRQSQMAIMSSPGNEWSQFRLWRWKLAENALAVLRACSQIYLEAHTLWLNRVLFFFDDLDALKRKLGTLSAAIIRQIRNILIVNGGWHSNLDLKYSFATMRDLQLDTLKILGAPTIEEEYWQQNINVDSLRMVLKLKLPWKNLYYCVPARYIDIDLRDFKDSDFSEGDYMQFHQQSLQQHGAQHDKRRLLKTSMALPRSDVIPQHDSIYVNQYESKRSRRPKMAIFSCHHTLQAALSEQAREKDSESVPTFLPIARRPARGYAGTTQDGLKADRYQSILDYDWTATWVAHPMP